MLATSTLPEEHVTFQRIAHEVSVSPSTVRADFAQVGYDQLRCAALAMPAPSIRRQPVCENARLAAQAMLELIAGKVGEIAAPPHELVVPESTRRVSR